MILPIYGYGQSVLKKRAEDIQEDYPALKELIENMWETMYNANGVGLAAPQIGLPIRLFVIDTTQMFKEKDKEKGIKRVFINAQKLKETGEEWCYEEGCLSIPDVRGEVERPESISLKSLDENFIESTEIYDSINARVIQHEYDHIDGILFVDKLSPVRKRLIRGKLAAMLKGKVTHDYRMKWK